MVFVEIRDSKDRVVMKQNDKGQVLLGRYEDLEPDIRDFAIDSFCDITGHDKDRVRMFMNFETDENAFCS